MNNISGFIQPSMFAQPNMVGIMQSPMPIISAGGRSDIMTIALVSAIVVVVLFIIYRNMSATYLTDEDEEIEEFSGNKKSDSFINSDSLTKCGWKVVMTKTCPYCIKQKHILGEHFPTFDNFDYTTQVSAVPTWINTKTREIKEGLLSHELLLSMSKCN